MMPVAIYLPALIQECAADIIFEPSPVCCAHLLFGGYIAHIVLGGKMGLDDPEAGTSHSFSYSFCKVAKPCSNP